MSNTDYHFHNYNDEWICKNYLNYSSYEKVAQAHNELFNTDITKAAMKGHCRKMGLKKPRLHPEYTEEEFQWLTENYPLLGVNDTLEQFNERFENKRTRSAIKNFGHLYCDNVKDDIANKNKVKYSTRLKEVGTLRLEVGRWVMKKEDGTWDQASRVIYEKNFGPIPKDYSIIFLDNNVNNLEPENLLAVPRKYLGLLSMYNLKSVSKEITLTGIEWCKLYEILKEEGIIKKCDIQ